MAEDENKKRTFGDKNDIEGIIGILCVIAVFYGIPSLVILTINFIQFVLFGKLKMSEFINHFGEFSYQRVNIFYQGLFNWFLAAVKRLTS